MALRRGITDGQVQVLRRVKAAPQLSGGWVQLTPGRGDRARVVGLVRRGLLAVPDQRSRVIAYWPKYVKITTSGDAVVAAYVAAYTTTA